MPAASIGRKHQLKETLMSIKVTPLTGSVRNLVDGIDLDLEPQDQINFDAAKPVHPGMQPDAWDAWKSCRDVA
jgi:hypothetical protein